MKDEIYVLIGLASDQETAVRRLFERIGRPDLIRSPYPTPYSFHLASPAEAALFLAEWKTLQLGTPEPFVRWDRTYSHDELAAAPLLRLIVRRPEKGGGGARYGTIYDLSVACPKCGSGARQASPLKVRPTELAKNGLIMRTLSREILLSEELADRLKVGNVSGMQLWPVESIQPGRSAPWTQLVVEMTMPPLSDRTEGIVREQPCTVCRRDGYFQTGSYPETLRYLAADVDVGTLPDVVQTYELFGNSALREPLRASQFAKPLILVKPNVYRILKDVKEIEFIPVEILD